jgi:hypothetical protein
VQEQIRLLADTIFRILFARPEERKLATEELKLQVRLYFLKSQLAPRERRLAERAFEEQAFEEQVVEGMPSVAAPSAERRRGPVPENLRLQERRVEALRAEERFLLQIGKARRADQSPASDGQARRAEAVSEARSTEAEALSEARRSETRSAEALSEAWRVPVQRVRPAGAVISV